MRGEQAGQKMCDLPAERVNPSPAFSFVGTDCFGPFTVKEGRKEIKKYGVVFTCLSSRAVHIEVLDDMTTDCFINVLRCFIAVRGPIRKLYSDQGTNFVGARNEFEKCKLEKYAITECFDWVFNVPHSSHMGGVWERQIKTIRNILNSMLLINGARLDTSSLRTFLYEAMSIINSRPLATVLDSDMPLTPNQLLTMKSCSTSSPPGHFDEQDTYSRKRWRVVQSLATEFWAKWKTNYVNNLQQRDKWVHKTDDIQLGDIVLVEDCNTPRSDWAVAKVIKTIPSKDQLIRKVVVEIADANRVSDKGKRILKPTVLERPVHKLVHLFRAGA